MTDRRIPTPEQYLQQFQHEIREVEPPHWTEDQLALRDAVAREAIERGRRQAERQQAGERESQSGPSVTSSTTATRRMKLTPMATVQVERARFLLPKRIPMRVVTILAGRGGEGKSTWMVDVVARCSRRELDGDVSGGAVLMIGGEDDLGTVLRPRLDAAGANAEHVFAMKVESTVDSVTADTVPTLPLDAALIRDAIIETGAKLVVIDPLASSMDGNPDRLAEVRKALDPLAALAAEMDVAVVCIMHFRKGSGNVSDLLSGSHAFRDAARSVLLVATDEQTGHKVLTIEKSNYSEARGESYAFRLESTEVPTADGGTTTVARAIDLGASEVSVDDIVNDADSTANLGEHMRALVMVVAGHPEEMGVEIAQVAIEADIDYQLTKRYLLRLAKSGRIEKAGRGRYRAKRTPAVHVVPSVPSVLSEP